MACDYSYTSSVSNVGFEGKTASVSYHFDFYTVTYDVNSGIGQAPVDNNGYSTGDTVEFIDADELTT